MHAQTIHGTGILTYIYHKNQPFILGKHTSPMGIRSWESVNFSAPQKISTAPEMLYGAHGRTHRRFQGLGHRALRRRGGSWRWSKSSKVLVGDTFFFGKYLEDYFHLVTFFWESTWKTSCWLYIHQLETPKNHPQLPKKSGTLCFPGTWRIIFI